MSLWKPGVGCPMEPRCGLLPYGTGKAPLGIRWIDINKGDDLVEELRSRPVAKEIKREKREDLFAATPPGMCKRFSRGLFNYLMCLVLYKAHGPRAPGPRVVFLKLAPLI